MAGYTTTPPTTPSNCPDADAMTDGSDPRLPLTTKIAAYEAFAAIPTQLDEMHRRLLTESQGHYVGAMTVQEFFDAYMPWNANVPDSYKSLRPPTERVDALKAMASVGENEMYSKFIAAFNKWPRHNAKYMNCRLKFKDSHSSGDKDCRNLGVDISGYSTPFVPRKVEQTMDFANVETWVELRSTENWDPFLDPKDSSDSGRAAQEEDPGDNCMVEDDDCEAEEEHGKIEEEVPGEDLDVAADAEGHPREDVLDVATDVELSNPPQTPRFPFESDTEQGCRTRAQLASYAGATMAVQFRHHLFTVVVFGSSARLIRWDRGAAVVTESFNYTERPFLLFEYFKRFTQLDRTQRGIDPNVTPATKANAQMARERLKEYASELWLGRAGDAYRDMVDIETQSFLQLQFQGMTWVIPAPHCDDYGLSPFGRASRARIAVDVASGKPHYLKDSWRDHDPDRLSESEVYKRLEARKIKFIAEMACGGDTGQQTQSHLYTSRPWVLDQKLRIRHLLAHIVILKTVGRSLMTFRTARQFLACLADGMEGVCCYEDALARAEVMHRDISAGNILMVPDPGSATGWKGIIIDWDHHVLLTSARILRTGTWQFISAYLAMHPDATHTPVDDRESALHVLIWISLRHLPHNCTSIETLLPHLNTFDDMIPRLDGQPVGPHHKQSMVIAGLGSLQFKHGPINEVIKRLRRVFSTRYEEPPDKIHGEQFYNAIMDNLKSRKENLEKPDWLFKEIRRAAEALPLYQENKEKADWVDNVRLLVEESRRRGSSGQPIIHRLLPSRPWFGYTRSVQYSDIDPDMETQPSQKRQFEASGEESRDDEDDEERGPKRRRV